MNRHERRARASKLREMAASRPPVLTRMADDKVRETWTLPTEPPFEVWVSREFLVQLFGPRDGEGNVPTFRATVCRVTERPDGLWDDGISWDELQRVKREIGRGDLLAVEVFPRDRDIVNVANMRHLWFVDGMSIGWVK